MNFLQEFDGKIYRANPATKKELFLKVFFATIGLLFSINFTIWFLNPAHRGNTILFWILFTAFIYQILFFLFEWYFSSVLKISRKGPIKRQWKVDVLTTYVKGEPKEMVTNTLRAIKRINYVHETYLCDEDNDPELKSFCEELGIHHITRQVKKDAKAGNINNALYNHASGELCVILDPDHVPHPDFLDEVLPYFEDEKVGFVQVVQAYYNHDATIISMAAAEQTYLYYGPYLLGLNKMGAVPAIGANCIFRRSALDSIGGHASGLAEDMHTSMLLHAKAWKSVYVPSVVTKGLVPWNYSGYCQQQLKWSKGTFDLLFRVYPKIFFSLSFNQKLYYLVAPLFFLYGLKSIIDFAIPITALFSLLMPLKVDFFEFLLYFLPIQLIVVVFRFFNQRWLYEQHEKGLFLLGGLLLKSSWWVAITGIVFSIFNRKVPYIPTPKNMEFESPWKLLVPNFSVMVLSAFAIVYGLVMDFQPYSLLMAAFAATNIVLLGIGNLMAMQTVIVAFHGRFKETFISKGSSFRKWLWTFRLSMYEKLQYPTVVLISILGLALFTGFYFSYINRTYSNYAKKDFQKNAGEQVLYGVRYEGQPEFGNPQDQIYSDFALLELDMDENLMPDWEGLFTDLYAKGIVPYVKLITDSTRNRAILDSDYELYFDEMIKHSTGLHLPLLLSVDYKYDIAEEYEPDDSVGLRTILNNTRRFINDYFQRVGAGNAGWVYSVSNLEDLRMAQYSIDFISWLFFEPDNFPSETDSLIILEERLRMFGKPVLIDNSTSTVEGINPLSSVTRGYLMNTGEKAKFVSYPQLKSSVRNHFENLKNTDNKNQDTGNSSSPTKWSDALPYVKGVAYNTSQGWRDGGSSVPLTRKKLDRDFKEIVDMGANTIRRFNPTIYDYNLMNACERAELNLIYGFWFDPSIDFHRDHDKIQKIRKSTMNMVRRHIDRQSIICWTLGNETWGQLRRHFHEPYLTIVRRSYVEMLEELACEIKNLDPSRPVMTAIEHTDFLPTELHMLRTFAPSIDIIGVNSFYEEQLQELDSVITAWLPGKPYMVSAFGPEAYWNSKFANVVHDSIFIEPTSFQKANDYAEKWIRYIEANQSNNLGGVAFCWQDRFDGSATWFGLTDMDEDKKPGYFAIRQVWTGKTFQFPLNDYQIIGPEGFLMPGWRYKYGAAALKSVDDRPQYKWIIYNIENFYNVLETDFSEYNYNLQFNMPDSKGDYRLHLYVKDGQGHVVSTSRALPLVWPLTK